MDGGSQPPPAARRLDFLGGMITRTFEVGSIAPDRHQGQERSQSQRPSGHSQSQSQRPLEYEPEPEPAPFGAQPELEPKPQPAPFGAGPRGQSQR